MKGGSICLNIITQKIRIVKSEPIEWSTELRGKKLRFRTDAGVFSKGEVDFGSRLLAETFVMSETEGDVLDVGCGYGPIGLSIAASFPERNVHMIDVNERALNLAKLNAERNNIKNVTIYPSDALSAVTEDGFAAILTNPPIRAGKETVFNFLRRCIFEAESGRGVVGCHPEKTGSTFNNQSFN